ncbi:uncharacterized protein ACN2A1_003127 [Glossina fuscipes fuscipes]
MPIHNKSSPSSIANHTTAEIDYHTSEAAKVKRNREQAYFNSYNFDAIEALPYDGDDDEDDDGGDSKVANEKLCNSHKRNNVATTTETTGGSSTIETAKNYLNLITEPSSDRYLEQLAHGVIRVDDNGGICGPNVNLKTTNHHNTHGKYSYLQRFAVIFGNNNNVGTSNNNNKKTNTINSDKSDKQRCGQHLNSQAPALCSTPANHNNRELCTITTYNTSDVVAENNNNSNGFLLPRAMLKYHSVGISNSMPLAAATVTATPVGTVCSCNTACSSSTRLSGDSNGKLDNNSSSHSRCSSSNSNINAMMTAMAINSTDSITGNKTRLAAFNQHANSHDINTGFTANATTVTTVATTSLTPSLNNSLSGLKNNTDCTKYKKNLSRNSSHTNVIVNDNNNGQLGISISDQNIKVSSPQNHQELTAHVTPTASDISNSQSNRSVALENSPTILSDLNISKRTLSHQSHYSTDKSGGSSGYYSSNVCSTYSLEEHIYSEPHLDILDLRPQHHHPTVSKHVRNNENKKNMAASPSAISDHNAQVACKQTLNEKISHTLESSVKHTLHQNRCTGYLCEENEQHEANKTKHNNRKQCEMVLPEKTATTTTTTAKKITTKYIKPDFSENLRCLETSIENLDRHLKTFPQLQAQEQLKPPTYSSLYPPERLRSYSYLPTIREGYDLTPNILPKRNSLSNHNWKLGHEQNSDDSLLDIDLDSFLPDNDGKPKQTKINSNVSKSAVTAANDSLDNPSFLSDEQEANHLKCAKYINSCPEDAYRVESDIIAHSGSSVSEKSLSTYVIGTAVAYPKRYEEQLHFENTRELLEDVRDKIRLLTHAGQSRRQSTYSSPTSKKELYSAQLTREDCLPKELTQMIKTLKNELELYLEKINHHNELEIRQLCTGLVKNQNIVKMKKAFERRRSCDTSTYEAVTGGIFIEASDPPISVHQQQITSIRCASDPNFKMKRKSLNEVFPVSDCRITEIKANQSNPNHQHQCQHQHQNHHHHHQNVQLQRNLSFHQPILGNLHAHDASTQKHQSFNNGGESSESNDKQSILDWHRKKPSIWELYYGTNRLQQSLLGKRNGTMITNAQNPSCYPSSRPESDFTLDLPRAEQLRIKMEKEKKFRQRCRLITTFLSLIFFLLTVMVVSLVLTRGKRMFGSMI